MPKLLVVGTRANVRHFADNTVQDLPGDGLEELVVHDLSGVDAQRMRASCELS
jgi:hypothetical protein